MASSAPEVSVIIPFYNEEENVDDTLRAVSSALYASRFPAWELILVNDGSTDSTKRLLEMWVVHERGWKIVAHDRNMGVGAALRTGIKNASGRNLVTIEGDLSYNPKDIEKLLAEIAAGYDIVVGSPYAQGGTVHGVGKGRYLLSRLGNLLLSRAIGLKSTCVTNSFRAYNSKGRHLASRVPHNDKRFHPTILSLAKIEGLRIREVPVVLEARKKGKSKTRIVRAVLLHTGLLFSFLKMRIASTRSRQESRQWSTAGYASSR